MTKKWPEIGEGYLKKNIHELNETEFVACLVGGNMITPCIMDTLEVLFKKGVKKAIQFEISKYPEIYEVEQ